MAVRGGATGFLGGLGLGSGGMRFFCWQLGAVKQQLQHRSISCSPAASSCPAAEAGVGLPGIACRLAWHSWLGSAKSASMEERGSVALHSACLAK